MSLLLLLRPTASSGPPPADVTIPGPLVFYREPATVLYGEPSMLQYREPAAIQGSDQ